MCLIHLLQLIGKLHLILLKGSEGLLNLSTGVGLGLNFIIGILDPVLGYKNLLGNLHKSSKKVIKRKNYNSN